MREELGLHLSEVSLKMLEFAANSLDISAEMLLREALQSYLARHGMEVGYETDEEGKIHVMMIEQEQPSPEPADWQEERELLEDSIAALEVKLAIARGEDEVIDWDDFKAQLNGLQD
jgi:hypothetical protein